LYVQAVGGRNTRVSVSRASQRAMAMGFMDALR
jgi:hypothetical protein